VHFPAWPSYPLAAPEPWASFIRAIPCYEHIKSLSITLRRREEKLWQTQSSDSVHCLPSSNGELFPVVLGLFAMAVLVCRNHQMPHSVPSWLSAMEKLPANFVSRATEMEVTIVGLQNAGKTSLLRVLAVSLTDHHLSRQVKERCDCKTQVVDFLFRAMSSQLSENGFPN
jgi:hypothetical protein